MFWLEKTKSFLFENKNIKQTITKNTAWLVIGQSASRLIRAVIVIYAARILGAASWGAFSYALGVATFLTIFSDIGINALITKEASQKPELKERYLATAFFTKLALLTTLTTVTILAAPHLAKISEAKGLIPILLFVFAFDTLRDLSSAVCRALEKMEIEAGLLIFTNAAIVALGLLFLSYFKTSMALAFAYAIGSGLGLLAAFIALRSHFVNLIKNFRRDLIGPIIKTAWPFGLLGIMGILMLNTDIIVLGWLETPVKIGYYAAAQKLTQLLYVIPSLIGISIFPVMTRLVKISPALVKSILEKSVALIILAAVPLAAIGIIFAPLIINLIFGAAYAPAVPTLRILLLTILIVFPSSILSQAIFIYDRQKYFIGLVVWGALGNALLDIALIPIFSIEGAAAATLIVQLASNIFLWHKIKDINHFSIWPHVKKYIALTKKTTINN